MKKQLLFLSVALLFSCATEKPNEPEIFQDVNADVQRQLDSLNEATQKELKRLDRVERLVEAGMTKAEAEKTVAEIEDSIKKL